MGVGRWPDAIFAVFDCRQRHGGEALGAPGRCTDEMGRRRTVASEPPEWVAPVGGSA